MLMGRKTVAEGIEKMEELEIVGLTGIRYGQGYLLERPEHF